jgi:hypothetical protein
MGKKVLSECEIVPKKFFSLKSYFLLVLKIWFIVFIFYFIYNTTFHLSIPNNYSLFLNDPVIAVANISNYTINLSDSVNISYRLIK